MVLPNRIMRILMCHIVIAILGRDVKCEVLIVALADSTASQQKILAKRYWPAIHADALQSLDIGSFQMGLHRQMGV